MSNRSMRKHRCLDCGGITMFRARELVRARHPKCRLCGGPVEPATPGAKEMVDRASQVVVSGFNKLTPGEYTRGRKLPERDT